MKRLSTVFLLVLILSSTGYAQKGSNVRGTLTPDGYVGKIGLEFGVELENTSGEHTNVSDGERQDMSFDSFTLDGGIFYPLNKSLTLHANLAYVNNDTNWKGNIFLDEEDFNLSGVKLRVRVKLYLK